MPQLTINLELIRSSLGPQVADEIEKVQTALNTMAAQTNSNPVGTVQPPPKVSAVNVSPISGSGYHDVAIQDNNPVNRGVNYFVEYSTVPNFAGTTTKTIPLGPSRNGRIPVGSGPVYFRAYSSYLTSSPSDPVYHGNAVDAGGTFVSTSGLPGVGSGTEPSLNPQAGAGFGFSQNRLPRDA